MSQRIELEPVGLCDGFYRVHVEGTLVGYISLDRLNGYEVYVGTEWSTARLMHKTFSLKDAKTTLLHAK